MTFHASMCWPISTARTRTTRSSRNRRSLSRRRKLLDLYFADQISADIFADEEHRLAAQIATLEEEVADVELARRGRDQAADEFELVTDLLASMDFDEIWNEASLVERRTLVEDLVDSIRIYPDRLTVQVTGAPPILVTLDEVGLRGGIKPVVSEGRFHRSGTKRWRLAV